MPPPRGPKWGHGIAGFSRGGQSTVKIEMQGFDTLITDLETVSWALPSAAEKATAAGAAMVASIAREIHAPHVLTGETRDSINEEMVAAGTWEVSVGTLQGRLLEYGFLHTGDVWVQYPFITPAHDMVLPLLFNIYDDIANIALAPNAPTTVSGPPEIAGPVNAHFSAIRSQLYSYSRFSGDLRVIGITLPGRQLALTSSRFLGDINSSMKSAIGQRVTARFAGSWATHGLRASLTASTTTSVGFQFPAAARGWNRLSGRVTGVGFNRGGISGIF